MEFCRVIHSSRGLWITLQNSMITAEEGRAHRRALQRVHDDLTHVPLRSADLDAAAVPETIRTADGLALLRRTGVHRETRGGA
jgi:hypothetical protein